MFLVSWKFFLNLPTNESWRLHSRPAYGRHRKPRGATHVPMSHFSPFEPQHLKGWDLNPRIINPVSPFQPKRKHSPFEPQKMLFLLRKMFSAPTIFIESFWSLLIHDDFHWAVAAWTLLSANEPFWTHPSLLRLMSTFESSGPVFGFLKHPSSKKQLKQSTNEGLMLWYPL